MGFLSELLANDKDGALGRHIYRVVSALGYVIVVGMVLFLGGLAWRMYSGAEVEIFGIRVANPAPPERTSETKSGPVTPLPPISMPTSPSSAATPAGSPPLSPLITAWLPMQGDFETCIQISSEALNRAHFSNVTRTSTGVQAFYRKEGVSVGVSAIRCLVLNGFVVAFVANNSNNAGINADTIDAIVREMSLKIGNVPMERYAGSVAQLNLNYNSLETRFESVEACRDFAKKIYEEKKALIRNLGAGAVFAQIGGVRSSVICAKDAANIHAVLSTHGFWVDEAQRVREAIFRELLTMKRGTP